MSGRQEPIEKVIERCMFRINHSLDCNLADILSLISEVERMQSAIEDLKRQQGQDGP